MSQAEPTSDKAAAEGRADPRRLREVLDGAENVLVFCHMNPDPDSLASALAMAHLLETRFGKTVTTCYRGIIGRAQNREMVRRLMGELKPFRDIDEFDFGAAVLVDAQPSFGFEPEDLEEQEIPVVACVDHHPLVPSTLELPFSDVRPDYGSTSTIMTEYLRLFSVEPSARVATALFYGIRTDTLGLTRRTSDVDREAYTYLQQYVDHEALVAIENPPLTRDYFRHLRDAIEHARVFGDLVLTHLDEMPYPDLVAEVADLLLKVEKAHWSVCMGWFDHMMFVSVRTDDPSGDAGVFVRQVVRELGSAGGHNTMAAARLALDDDDPAGDFDGLKRELISRLLEQIGRLEEEGEPLVG